MPYLEDVSQRLDVECEEFCTWETDVPVDLAAFKLAENRDHNHEGPHAELIGPMPDRGPATGIVQVCGERVAQWGAPDRCDIAFSVSKSGLSLLVGLALADGLISELDAPVSSAVDIEEFSGPNTLVTWRHLLSMTSEWEGTLWGIPDAIDFNRIVPSQPNGPVKGTPRERGLPGSVWEFNDVRVNALCLALTFVWRRSLEEVFFERIMNPIGASSTWRWHGYEGAIIDIDGCGVPVVSGGAHWGGGMVISGSDLALLGSLYAQRGEWKGVRLVPSVWFDAIRSPAVLNPDFGLLWWTNVNGAVPMLSSRAIWSSGVSNFLLVEPERSLVLILRWFAANRRNDIIARVLDAL